MKSDLQFKLRQVLVIIGLWMFFGFVLTVYDHLVLLSDISVGPSVDYSFWLATLRNVGGGLIGGILGGGFMTFYINVKYQDKPYGYTIVAVSVSFVLIIALVTVVMGITIVPMRTGKPWYDPASRQALMAFLRDPAPIKSLLVWSFIVAVTQMLVQVSQKFGRGAFWSLVSGKYQIPREETRTFMFLDLNASTAMAERLGDKQYHLLLREFFADITQPILNNKGSIYQYVGDEVVIAWGNQASANNNCVQCFFDIRQTIADKAESYQARFGVVPSFKAGIHCGNVVAGEVGIIKRDITYSGDVLNTTSRIQGMCKQFNTDLIVSHDVAQTLNLFNKYQLMPLGHIKLRGKENELLLNTVMLVA
jgi:adenylate cyclase